MPSFDIVSEVDKHEFVNAIDQTNREVANRYDFKNTGAHVKQLELTLTLHAEAAFQIKQMTEILYQKIAKRGIDLDCLEAGEIEETGNKARQIMIAREGVDKDTARKIIKLIKQTKLKVQVAIQGVQVRVSGKKKDDLQRVISLLKQEEFEVPLQFINYRD